MEIIKTYEEQRIPGESMRESYKRMMGRNIANIQARAGAEEDLWAEDWLRKNPGRGMEQARSAYRSRAGSVGNPVKAPDANSAAIKFGKRGGGMFVG
jgi:hypothetical protein